MTRTSATKSLIAGITMLLTIGACERETGRKSDGGASKATAADWTIAPSGTGTVRGVVTFRGTPPPPERIDGARCHPGAADFAVSPVSVNENGRVRDVVVFVKGAPPVETDGSGLPPAVLDQVNCRYVPAVLALRTGQTLKVTSSDPTLHNVHTMSGLNPQENFGFPDLGQDRVLTFKAPESFAVKCDVHPWMRADVHVFDHPYYATVDDAGTFEIGNLPAGEHVLVVRHGFLGDVEVAVTVEAGKTAEVVGSFGKE